MVKRKKAVKNKEESKKAVKNKEESNEPKEVDEVKTKLPDRIQAYFNRDNNPKEAFHSKVLFQADKEDIDLKTELTDKEIVLINKLKFNDIILQAHGMLPIYREFLNNYMRLKVSRNRASRKEFVDINRTDKTDEALSLASNLKNITDTKK